jgi:hypothetical protein
MGQMDLEIDQLQLDLVNPRISKADGQREAIQRILEDQGAKLGNLAESIVEDGLNPMDRLLVIKSESGDDKYTVLEGNRRTAAVKILKNPAMLTDLELPNSLQKKLEKLAQGFDPKSLEPIACFEVDSRAEGNSWIEQRHTGEDEGRGIVRWSGVAASRFRGRDPALQAFDFVKQFGSLSEEQKRLLEGRFPITTLDRLLSTPSVRSEIGFNIKDGKLLTALAPDEAIKPLRRIVMDLAEKAVNVSKLKSKEQQRDYISKLARRDKPKASASPAQIRPVDEFSEQDFTTRSKAKSKRGMRRTKSPRTVVVPRTCHLNITNSKIDEIYNELRTLQLAKYPHSISVMLRVFLETSVDHYLSKASIPLVVPTPGGDKDKNLRKKVDDCIDHMVKSGADRKDFKGVITALRTDDRPFSPDLLHSYVHNRFVTPLERDLTAAWDNGQPFFARIWQ